MVSTNTDFIKTTESSSKNIGIEARSEPMEEIQPATSTKHTLCRFSNELICTTGNFNTTSHINLSPNSTTSKISKRQSQNAHSAAAKYLNIFTKLEGHRWDQYFEFEKVIKQIKHAEKINIKMVEDENIGNGNNVGTSNNGGFLRKASSVSATTILPSTTATLAIRAKLFNYPHRFQVQRLNGNDMHYYGMVPKRQTLEIVVCNSCKAIYTIVGLSNHIMRQHPVIWNSAQNKMLIGNTKLAEGLTVSSIKRSQISSSDSGQNDDILHPDIEPIEVISSCSDASVTALSCTDSPSTSSSLAPASISTVRALKGNRNNCSSSTTTFAGGSAVSNSGRSKSKSGKQHLPSATCISTATTESSYAVAPVLSLPLILHNNTSPSPANDILLTSLTSTNQSKFISKKLSATETILNQKPTTTSTFSNDTTKAIPTLDILNASMGANTPYVTSSFATASSNSSLSSSSSTTAISTPSLKHPIPCSISMIEVSNNETGQFEIQHSSTASYYLKNFEKDLISGNADSFESTDNVIIRSISKMRDVIEKTTDSVSPITSTSTNYLPSSSIQQNVTETSTGEEQVIDATNVSDNLTSTGKEKFLPDLMCESSFYIKGDQHDKTVRNDKENCSNNVTKDDILVAHLNLSTVPTSVCGGSVHCDVRLPSIRPLKCNAPTYTAKRQVIDRSEPLEELMLCYGGKVDRHVLPILDVVDSSNSSSSTDFERRNTLGAALSSVLQNATASKILMTKSDLDSHKLDNNELLSLKLTKSEFDKGLIQSGTTDKELTTESINRLLQNQHQTKQLCLEHSLNVNTSDEKSIQTLGGIFDHTSQFEIISSKFISEILNGNEYDINFDNIDTTSIPSSQVTRLIQPAAKRMRLNDDTIIHRSDELSTFNPQDEKSNFVSEQTVQNHMENIEYSRKELYETCVQQDFKKNEIKSQTEINNKVQQKQLKTTEANQFQHLIYQPCAFNKLEARESILQQQGKELVDDKKFDLPTEEKTYYNESESLQNDYHSVPQNKSWTLSYIEGHFNAAQMTSLTDQIFVTDDGTIDNFNKFTRSHTFSNSAAQYILPIVDELLFELSHVNNKSIKKQQQEQAISETFTEASNCRIVAKIHPNNKTSLGNQFTNKTIALFHNFSSIKTFNLARNCIDQKSRNVTKNYYDDGNFKCNKFIGLPRPLSVNHFGTIRFPLTLSSTFRKDILTVRKANHITFNSTGSRQKINYRYNSENSIKNATSTITIVNNTDQDLVHYSSNLMNELDISHIKVSANLTKQQNNICSSNMMSPTNTIISSPPVSNSNNVRHQQKSIISSFENTLIINNTTCLNGKNKTNTSTNISPIAIINPTVFPSSAAHTNNSNTTNNSSHIFGLHKSPHINHYTSAIGPDHMKLLKRSPVSKFSSLKSTHFTPKILTELLLSDSCTLTELRMKNGIRNCDNAFQPQNRKYLTNNRYSFYGKRTYTLNMRGERRRQTTFSV